MIDKQATIDILKRVPLFRNLNRRQLDRIAKEFIQRQYEAGEAIVTQGRDGYGFFTIASGQADVLRERGDGEKVSVNTFGPSDFFGELALLDGGPRTASVVAQEPTTCLILPRVNFRGVLRQDADMAIIILEEMARRFRVALDAL